MIIDNIHLSDFSCQNLFKNTLIGDVKISKETDLPKIKKIEFLGLNQKNILFLVNDPESKYLPGDEMQVLVNLLNACHLSMEDVALVNYAHNPQITYQDFLEQLKSKKLLVFGVSTGEINLPFNVPHFQIQSFQEQFYLFNPSFEKIINDVALKGKLWGCLKKLFSF